MICAIVKCNAYGHGMGYVASRIEHDVDCFGVASVDEAVVLRTTGITKDIIAFGIIDETKLSSVVSNRIIPSINSISDLMLLEQYCRTANIVCRVHIKLNIGLNRLGVDSKHIKELRLALDDCQYIKVTGIYTHYGDSLDREETIALSKEFKKAAKYLDCKDAIWHSAASNTLALDSCHMDMVRIGIGLYGYGCAGLDLVPAMSAYGRVIKIREVAKGANIGYSKGYTALDNMTVATVTGGYGDGILRGVYQKVKINGTVVDILGHISMDMFCIDVTKVAVKLDDRAYVLGEGLMASDIAMHAGTIEYQLLTVMNPRGGVVYIN